MEYEDSFFDTVKALDDQLSKGNTAIYDRPEIITTFIIKNLITAVRNIDTSTSDGKLKLHMVLLHDIVDWYKSKYGKELLINPKTDNKPAYVQMRGIPVVVSLPMTLSKIMNEKESALCFPDGATRGELVLDYIKNVDMMKILSEKEKIAMKKKIRIVLNNYRSIYKHFLCCNIQKEKFKNIQDIWKHLSFAVKNISDDYHNGVSIAIWEMFFAVELSIKLLYFDTNGTEIKGHQIDKIINKFDDPIKTDLANDDFLNVFPNSDLCIKYRYSELVEYDMKKINNYYQLSIAYISKITNKLSHSLTMKNGIIIFRNPYSI
jgi:hypothetical protein